MLQELFMACVAAPTELLELELWHEAMSYCCTVAREFLKDPEKSEEAAYETAEHLLLIEHRWVANPQCEVVVDCTVCKEPAEMIVLMKADFDARKYLRHEVRERAARMEHFNLRDANRRVADDEIADATVSPGAIGSVEWLVHRCELAELPVLIAGLPTELGDVVRLVVCEGLSSREAAKLLGINHATVSRRLLEAVRQLWVQTT